MDGDAILLDWNATDARLFADPAADWFASHFWFDTLARHAVRPGCRPACVVVGAAALPVWCRGDAVIVGMAGDYALEYTPVLPSTPAEARRAGREFAYLARRRPVRLDALDPAQSGLDDFFAGVADAGLKLQRFRHFGDWFAPVTTTDFAAWLESRPGALRSTVARKLRRASKTTRFDLIAGGTGLDDGIDAFEHVYARSWKRPEPFPAFNACCMRELAAAKLLRLGILQTKSGPIAAQYWAVAGGRAMLLKLAHDHSSQELSPGTVLTARMIAAILEQDRPTVLDFGRGDDPYKRLWVDQRRERTGVLLLNPRRLAGIAGLARARCGDLKRMLTRTD